MIDDTHDEPSRDVQALINNGLDFLQKARQELDGSEPKFSIVSFWTAVEILLKVPLAHEHWTLVCSGKKWCAVNIKHRHEHQDVYLHPGSRFRKIEGHFA